MVEAQDGGYGSKTLCHGHGIAIPHIEDTIYYLSMIIFIVRRLDGCAGTRRPMSNVEHEGQQGKKERPDTPPLIQNSSRD